MLVATSINRLTVFLLLALLLESTVTYNLRLQIFVSANIFILFNLFLLQVECLLCSCVLQCSAPELTLSMITVIFSQECQQLYMSLKMHAALEAESNTTPQRVLLW